MPLGAFKLNSISKVLSTALPGARKSAATITSSGTFDYSTAKYGSNSLSTTNTTSRTYAITVDPVNTNWYFTSSNTWTVEFWVNFTSLGSETTRTIFRLGSGALGISGLNISDTIQNGTWQLNFNNNSTYLSDAFPSPGGTSANTWYHIAIVSDGSVIRLYANGTQNYSGSVSITGTNRTMLFGHSSSSASTVLFDDIRISNIARYSAAFTPPQYQYSNDASTLALFNMNNTNTDNVTDYTRTSATITNSSVTVNTTTKQIGTGSAYFSGTSGKYLRTSNLNTITGDFTIELYARMAATNAGSGYIIKNYNYSGGGGFGTGAFTLYFSSSTGFIFGASGISNITGSIALNTWYHFAIVRSGTTLSVYKNGSLAGSATWTTGLFNTGYQQLLIGAFSESAETLNGYIDEVRVSNIARYTTSFAAPSAAFINDANTVLLIHADGANGSITFTDDNA